MSILLYLTLILMMLFVMFVVLGACIEPQRMLPILLAVVSLGVLARQAWERLNALHEFHRNALRSAFGAERLSGSGVTSVDDRIAGVLREAGFSPAHAALFTLLILVSAGVFFAFTLLGCFFFLDVNSIVPSLVSSGIVLSSALVVRK